MTRQAFEAQAGLIERLEGQRCTQVSIGEDDELILDFGALDQVAPGEFDGESWLIVECPWRIDALDEVLCGWHDDDEYVTESVRQLIGLIAGPPTVRRPGFDLTLPFNDGHQLRVFPDCLAYFADDTTSLAIPWYTGGKAVTGE